MQTLIESKKIQQGDQISKQVLNQILQLLSIFAEEKEIQAQCRRQKLLKTFLKIFSDIYSNNQSPSQLDIEISYSALNLLAKITFKSKKNQDYVIKKKAYELVKGILVKADNIPFYQAAIFFLTNSAFSNDSKLLLWVSGIVQLLKQRISQSFQKYVQQPTNNDILSEIQSSFILLLKLTSDTREIAEEVNKDQQLIEIIQYFTIKANVSELGQNYQRCALYASCIGIIRKISGFKDLRQQIIQTYQQNPIDFIKIYHSDTNFQKNKIISIFVFKELLAILGVFAIEEQSRNYIIKNIPNIFNYVVQIALKYGNDSKLIKTAIGCLTNFTVLQEIRDSLSKQKDFYILVYHVIENFDYSVSLLEYTLKMILNTSSNELCFQNFSAPKFTLKLIFLSFIYQTHYSITSLLIKIFRVLSTNDLVLQTIVKCAREYEVSNREFKFSNVLVEGMKAVLNPQPDMILDIILFISMIMQQDREFIQEVNDKTQFIHVLKEYIDRNRNDQVMLDKISQCVAYLPLEDFKNMLNL